MSLKTIKKMNTKHNLTAFLFLGVILLLNLSLKSQNSSDTISMIRKGDSYCYYLNNEALSKVQLMDLLKENTPAIQLMEKSNNLHNAGYYCSISGGIFIGFSLGWLVANTLVGAKFDAKIFFPIIGAGVSLIVVGICFEVGAKHKAKDAIAVYNNSKRQNNTTLNLGLCTNGMMVKLNF